MTSTPGIAGGAVPEGWRWRSIWTTLTGFYTRSSGCARGEGKFERTSWDEAYDTIEQRFNEIKEKYGPAADGLVIDISRCSGCGACLMAVIVLEKA